MKIRMKNEIQLDGKMEVVDQVYEVDYKDKGDYAYLIYENEDQERVVLKFHDKELVMTRFSTPKTIMHFVKDEEVVVTLPTPMGIQHFITDTQHYHLENQMLRLHYQLKPLEGEQIFASYQMEISWG